jgi:hypothetical protein
VPERECKTPILTVSSARTGEIAPKPAIAHPQINANVFLNLIDAILSLMAGKVAPDGSGALNGKLAPQITCRAQTATANF